MFRGFNGSSTPWARYAVAGLLLPFVAIVVGLLSATANPLLIAPIVGGILGVGLMMRPKMMMLDEPSLGLSPRLVDEVFDKTVAMAQAGLTVMLVEQNAARALEIADRGYVLELGRNRHEGTGRELLDSADVRTMYLGGGAR